MSKRVFWVSENPKGLPVIYDRAQDAYLITITEPFLSMTVEQRMAVESLLLETAKIGEYIGQHQEEFHGTPWTFGYPRPATGWE